MTHNSQSITRPLKILSASALIIAACKIDTLSRYWQQEWKVALPLSGNLSSQTWLNELWSKHLQPISSVINAAEQRLQRAGAAISAEPAPVIANIKEQSISAAPCEPPSEIAQNTAINPAITSYNWPIKLAPKDKILLVGDSMMQGVAPYVMSGLRKRFGAEALDLSKHSTGLAYPGFFNWPEAIKQNLDATEYKALVIFLGANDTWDIIHNGKAIAIGNEFWRNLYTERVETILTYAQHKSVQVIWLGAPPMGREKMNKYIPALNHVYDTSIKKFSPLAVFAPTTHLLSTDGHSFVKSLTQPDQGEIMLRTNDGVHFTPAGQKLIARLVLDYFQASLDSVTVQ